MLAVDVAAVREHNCSVPLVSGGVVIAACVKDGDVSFTILSLSPHGFSSLENTYTCDSKHTLEYILLLN